MIVNYVVVGVALLVTVMLMYYSYGYVSEDSERAQTLHRWTRWSVPSAWVILSIIITLLEFWPGA